MSKSEEIKALIAQTDALRAERSGWQITGPVCTWTVLTERIIRNEKSIAVLAEELAEEARETIRLADEQLALLDEAAKS